jgi:hypothetical protein
VSDLAQALMVAIRVHAGQVDKQREPYLLHVLRVVEAVGPEAKTVAALHDVVEDGPAYVAEAVANLGLSGEEFNAVLRLTRRTDGETYKQYIGRIAQRGQGRVLAVEVKLADLKDNLGRIPKTESCVPCGGSGSFWPDPRPCVECAGTGRKSVGAKWASLKARYEKALATLEAGGKT